MFLLYCFNWCIYSWIYTFLWGIPEWWGSGLFWGEGEVMPVTSVSLLIGARNVVHSSASRPSRRIEEKE